MHFCNSRAYSAFMKAFAAVPAHTRWLWPLFQDQYEVKSTCKFIFIFPHYLPAYQNEGIKGAAGLGFWLPARDDFHSSKLANQTLGWPQLTLRQKEGKSVPTNYSVTLSGKRYISAQKFEIALAVLGERTKRKEYDGANPASVAHSCDAL